MSKMYNRKALRTLIHEELEPRLLFSADVIPGLDINAAHELVLPDDFAGELQGERNTEAETEAADAPAIELRHELVIVNENVADYEGLIAGLQDSDPNRVIDVVMLEADRNGIEQVSEILAERNSLDAVHIISHGSDGAFALGSDWLNSNDLTANSDAITAWSDALTENADILLYGCNIAVDEDGQELTAILAGLTGADVAASDDVTGNETLGGDWNLEYQTDAVEASTVLNDGVPWEHTLGEVTNQAPWTNLAVTTDRSTTISENYTVTATPGSDRLLLVTMVTRFGFDQTIDVTSASFGGVQMHEIVEGSSDATRNGVWMGYLLDSEIPDGEQTLTVSFTSTVSDPTGTKLLAATYVGVDQTTPINDSSANNTKVNAPISFGSQIDYVAGGEVVYVASYGGNSNINTTEPAGYSKIYTNEWSGLLMTTIAHMDDTTTAGNSPASTAVDFEGTDANHSLAVVALNPVLNQAPVITSNGGGATANINVAENTTTVTTVTATDGDLDTPTYSISGGDDAAKFNIDPDSGALTFAAPPDFETPTDTGTDNIYDVTVQADDGNSGTDTQAISVTVTDTNDAPVMTAWFNDAWDSRKGLTINAASVAGDLTEFPVLITLNVDADLAAQALANGDDILFTAADGVTQLAHEIEFFDETTGELRVWVKTDLSASVDTNVFMYFGNDAAGNQENIPAVWANYVGVYHLSESPTGAPGEIIDSSGSGNHATTEGSMDAADSVSTTIGQVLAFDGSDDMIRITDSASLDSINDEATFSLWINFVDSADGDTQIIMSSSNRYSGWDGYEWAQQNDGDHFFYPDAMLPDTNYNLGADPFTNGDWHHLAATMDFATKEVKVYVDGTPITFSYEGVPGSWTSLTSSDDMLWGGNPDRATRYFLGMMDEIRIADVARSQEWIQTEVNNQSAPGTFFSVDATEDRQDKLTDINEDDFNSAGDTVLSIINSSGADRIMDSDTGALEGIAVTAVDDTNGVWQYDANADGTWLAFGAVSDTNAALLDTGALVRFVPGADYNGSAGDLTFHAWDQTSGANGNTGVDVSTSGGSTAFSSEAFAAGLNVNPVNDAPINSIPELTANVLPGTVNGPATVASADFNGDGFMDIVAGTLLDPSSSSLSWYQNDGSENFTKNTITTAGMTADMIRDVVVADVDGDSYIDIVTVSQNDNQVAWWKNDGLGNFTQFVVSTTLESPRSVVATDFDGDGDMDIIAGGRPTSPSTAPTIIWFDNDGSEVFTTRIVATLSTIGQVTSLAVGNMDGDADLDIVAAGFSSDSFSWFEHQGAGTFATHTIDSGVSVDGAAFVSVADIDGDGDQDVATAAQYANAVSWYKNDGSGNFGAGPEWTITANGARSVYTADLENDGDVDIIAGSVTDQTVIAHLNDGSATPGFTAQTISSTSAYPLDLSMGDIDGDGDFDLIEAAYSPNNQVRWYENHGGFQTTADTLEDTPLTFSAANGNLISISDPDAGGAAVQVTLSSTNGTTTLAGTAGLTFGPGDGTDDAVMTFTGTIADINIALDGLVFTSTTDFVGTANLQIATNDLGNTGTGGALSDTDTVDIAVNPVNDAPILDIVGDPTLTWIYEGDINNSGDSVVDIIASAGGNPITDVDASPVEGMALTWVDNSNGIWQYSTDGGSNWFVIGNVSDTSALLLTDAANNRIRFAPAQNFNGTAQVTYRAWDRTDANPNATAGVDVSVNGDSTAYSGAAETATLTIQPIQIVLYFSTTGDVSASGAPGLDSWDNAETLALGDPNVAFEPGTSAGTLYRYFDLRTFNTGTADPVIDAIHHVSKNVTIGGNVEPGIDLLVGDILFAVNANNVELTGTDLVTINTDRKSLYMFRPDTPGDPKSGSFSIVLDNFSGGVIEGVSLVEIDTWMGDTLLQAGTFLYNSGNSRDILHYTADDVGEGTTTGTSKMLLSGVDIGLGNASTKISGLDLIEATINLGNTTIVSGNILVTLDGNDSSVGNNGLAVTANDIFYLDVSTTTLGPAGDETGTTSADAYQLIEGADLNLDTTEEEVTGLSLDILYGSGNEDPDISFPGSSITYTENNPAVILDGGATVSDPDSFDYAGGILNVDFESGGTTDDRLAIRNQGSDPGQVGVVLNTVTFGGVTIGTFNGGTGSNPLVIHFNSNATSTVVQAVMRNITFENVSDDPATAPRTVRFVVTDGDGGTSNVERKTVNIIAVNDAPALATNAGMTVDEGSTGTIITTAMLNEGDPDDSGAGLIYTVTVIPANGTLYRSGVALGTNDTFTQADIDANLITYDHDDTETVSDSFTFSLADGGENGASPLTGQVFNITITPVNDAPVLGAIGPQSVDEGATLTFTASATDSDIPADTLTYSLDATSIAAGMSITAGGDFSWTPTETQDGDHTVTITVTDNGSGNLSDSETITITCNEVNTAPVLNGIGNQSVDEGATLTFTATATDSDIPADTLTYSLDATSIAAGMSITAGGDFSWTPTETQDGDHTVTITVTDNGSGNLSDSETITITCNEVNTAPVLNGIGNQSVDEGATLTFTATATDSDIPADTLTYSLDATSIAAGMSITAGGDFSWTPTETQDGDHTVTITVTDNGSGNLSDSETITITCNEVNTAPVLNGIGNQSVDEGATLTFTATATDSDIPADTLTYSLDATSIAAGMSITAGGDFSWTPTETQDGDHTVTITVTDNGSGNLSDSETITITCNEVNTAPVLNGIGNQSVDEGATLTFTATATDSDIPADTLTYSLDATSIAAGMSITAGGDFSWTPTETQDGDHTVTITVTDNGSGNLSDSETITITCNEVNTAPVLNGIGNQSVDEGATLTFTATATDSDIPADTLTYSLDATSIAAGMSITAGGDFSWTPTETQDGDHTVTITVTDNGSGNLSDSETITITCNEVNTAPVLNGIGNQSVDEGATLTFTATATDSDIPADTLTYSLDATSIAAGMSITAGGDFSWTPTETQDGDHTVTITVTDNGSGNLSDSETITITCNEVNTAPVLNGIGNQSVDEGATLTFTATATDSDIPADTLTYSLDATSIAAGMSITAGGDFSWTPTETQDGDHTVTITVTDNGSGNLSDSETITITCNEVNTAPVLNGIGNQSVDEGATLTFTATATDSDIPADTLTYSLDATSIAAGMSITAGGDFSWTPTETQDGDHTVTITVTDNGSGNLSDSETITITCNEVNTAPVLNGIGNQSVDEGATLTFTATATDSDIPADTLTYSLDATSIAAGMSITAGGDFSWTPTETQDGDHTVTITVTDNGSGNLSDSETITITCNEVNTAPVLNGIGNQSVDEGATLTFTATATDSDIPADTLTYSLDATSIAAGMSITAGGDFSWTPTETQDGDHTVTITVTDNGSGNLSDSETITITCNEVNTAPVLNGIGNQSVDEGSTLTFTATATDSDIPADTLTYSLDATSIAAGMSITAGGDFSWTPTETQDGDHTVTITVTDNGSGNLSDSETITITCNEVNTAPVLNGIGNQSVDEGATLTFTASATDSDIPADTLTYSLDATSIAAGMSITAGGDFSWTPTETQDGDHTVTITVTDNGSGNLSDSETITITCNEVNTAPVLNGIGNQSVDEGATLTFTATATDSDIPADTLTYSLDATSIAAGMSITAGGDFSWTPTETQDGDHTVTITVTDNGSGNLSDSETITITCNEVNTAPVLNGIGNQSVDEGATLTFTASATDSDIPADTLTYSLDATSIAAGMSITAGGDFSWTPTETQDGDHTVTITVTDNGSGNLSDSETITITCNEVNTAPVLNGIGNQSVDEGATLTFTATATDSDIPADTLTYSLDATSIAAGMSITAGGDFSWTPTETQDGDHTVTITVTDNGSGNLSDSETITITCNEVNTAPVLNGIGNQSVDEGATLTFTASATDSDIPADTLTYSLDATSIAAGMSITAGGDFSWTPTETQDGDHTVTITVTDNGSGNLSDSETITITCNEVNTAPVLNGIGNQSVDEGATLTFTATATDSDIPADTLTYSLDATSIAAGMSITAGGDFSWTPTETQDGDHTVTITVTDNGSGNLSDSETITITCNEVNTAPVLNGIGNQSVDEGATLTFTATATDSDIPADTLTYSLDATSIAAGMSITAGGDFSWTPTETQDGDHTVTITVTDNGSGNLSDSETITITCNEVNTAPVLNGIGNQSVDEGATLTFTATATDSDIPADTLTYSLDATSIAAGMSITAGGDFSWTPTETQDGDHTVTITVTDNGSGNLSDSETITITCNEVNTAPVLNGIGNQSVDEGATLTFTATATDSDIPADTLTYSLDATSIAAGMSITAGGDFSWTPTETQDGDHTVTITVTDNGSGNLSDSETITITCNEVNTAPVLNGIGNQSVDEGATLTFTASATDSDIPADTLTYSLDATSIAAGMSITAGGDFSWTPTETQDGDHTVTITVTDNGSGNLSDSETITITCNEVNTAPVLNGIGNQSVDEGATLTFTATATDSDIPADTLTYSLDATSIAAGMSITAGGDFSWTPTETQDGDHTVTITVTDNGSGNLSDSETITITCNEVNTAPVLNGIGNQSVDEGATLTFTATATDSDIPADTLTYSLDATSIAAGMSITAGGDFSWTPTETQDGDHTVTITVTDNGSGNLSDSETITITCNEVNTAPVLNGIGNQSVDEGATLTFTATATDSDIPADTLTYSLDATSIAAGMSITAGGDFSWTPTETQDGDHTVTITVTDNGSGNLSDSETITITCNEVNTAPVLNGIGNQSVDEGATLTFTATATDSDIPADTLTYSLDATSIAAGMSITAGGDFSWTPTETQDGDHTVTITVTDNGSGNLSDSETITITCNEVNTAPVLNGIGNQSVDEGATLTFTATATDSDIPADTLTYSLDATSIAAGMSITAGGDFSWTPTETQDGDHTVTITVTDNGSGNLSDSETITITCNEVNTAPVLNGIGNQSVDEGATLTFTATATDSDIPADTLTYSLDATSIAAGMSITAGGDFSWTPTETQDGDHTVTITVTDNGSGNLSDSETITITCNEVNTAPVLNGIGNQSVDEGATLTFTASATDSDIPADTLTYSLDATSIAAGMSITAGGDFSWTPTETQDGDHTVTITVTDNGSGNLSDSETITITCNEVNTAPVLNGIGNQSVDEGATLTFTATATDSDIPADTLTYSLDATSIAAGMSITAGGDFSWTPTETQDGDHTVTITVTDNGSGNLSDSETITITCNEVNTAPVLNGIGNQSVDEGATLTFTATATDSDIPADTLTYSLDATSIAAGMSITAGGDFSWTPTETQDGDHTVTITVTDNGSGNLSDSETITITCNEVNTAPVLNGIGNQSVDEGATLTFTATATDSDIPADTLTYSLDATSIAAGMSITAGGDFSWTPTETQDGDHTVTITVTDNGSGNLSDSETITITCNEVNTAPVLNGIGNQSVDEGATLTFTATATDSDIPADTLTYSLDATSIAAGMSITAGGDFSWTPTETQDGDHTVTITVTDNGSGNLSDSETITITCNEVNTAPVLNGIGNQSVDEGATLTFTATATDSDIPADTLTYSLDATSIAAGMSITAGGDFSWTPTETQDGDHTVTITVTDNGSGNLSDSETITITCNEVNTAPVLNGIGNQSVDEGATLTFTATATDSDIPADTLTYSLDATSIAAGMSITAGGDFSWTPTETQDGDHTVTITVTDNGSGNLSDSETITITCNEVNTAPVLNGIGNQSVDEGATLTFTATATDSDIPADTLTYSLDATSIAAGMSITAGGDFSWTPTETQDGDHTVTITVTDNGSGNLSDSETITITCNEVNTAPVLNGIGNQSVDEGSTLTFTATATDSDIPADTLTYSLDATSIAAGMSITAGGDFSWTPTETQDGDHTVTITVTDNGSGNLSDSETITITCNEVNTAPVLNGIGNQSVDEGATLTFTATATDSDIPADTLTYSLDATSIAAGMSITAGGDFSWTPTETQDGDHTVTITVTDNGTGTLSDSETFTITCNEVNTAPVLNGIGNQSVDEGSTLTFTATATDSDIPADTLTYSLDATSIAAGMSITAGGDFSWTPTETQDGDHTVTITVTDNGSGNLSDSETFNITVTGLNDSPTISLTNLVNSIAENTDTTTAVKIADIVITDDALGTNDLTLAGADAASFEIIGSEVFLRAGTSLDFETKATFDVTVEVDDGAIPGTPDDTAAHTLTITDVNEEIVVVPPPPVDAITDTTSTTEPPTDTAQEDIVENETVSESNLEQTTDTTPVESTDSKLPETVMPDYSDGEHFVEENLDETLAMENDLLNSAFDNYLITKESDRYAGPRMHSELNWSYTYNYLMPELISYQAFLLEHADIFNISLHSDVLGLNQDMTENESFSRQLEHLYQDMDESYTLANEQKTYQVKMATGVFTTFAVGVVSYLLRAGSLMSAFISTVPLWKGLDPIAVLASKKKKEDMEEPSTKTDTNSDTLLDKREIE